MQQFVDQDFEAAIRIQFAAEADPAVASARGIAQTMQFGTVASNEAAVDGDDLNCLAANVDDHD